MYEIVFYEDKNGKSEIAMPSELRKAHQQNDRAVMQVYGFSIKYKPIEYWRRAFG